MDYLYALQTIRENVPAFVNYFFLICSEIVVMLGPVIGGVVFWSFDKAAGATLLLGYSGSCMSNQIVKNIACIYRPWILDHRLYVEKHALKTATGYSFPSGHTTSAASNFLGVAYWKHKKIWLVILMIFLTLLVAFSRNWLGAHTLKDVTTAIFISCIVVLFCNYLKILLDKNPSLDVWVFICGIIFSIGILIFLNLKKYPIDYNEDGSILVDPKKMLVDCYTTAGLLTGALTGWFLERKFVKFSLDVSVKLKIIRSLVGVLCFAILYFSLSAVFSFAGPNIQHLLKYFIIPVWGFFLWPLIFNAYEKKIEAKKVEKMKTE